MAAPTTVSTKTALWIIGGVCGLVVVIALMASGDDDRRVGLPITSSTQPPTTTEQTALPDTGSDLDPLNCERLLSNEEAVLALEEDEPDGGLISSFTFSQGERCVHEDADESRNYVILEPTTAADFDADATRLDADPVRIDGIGETAVWFGGTDAGSLTVAADSDHGTVLFRLEFGRVGVTDERRREHAVALARLVLRRFPGIVLPPSPAPERIEVEHPEPVEPPPADLLDSVLAGVDDGRWSEYEGLVAALEYLVGDTDGGEVLPADGLVDPTASTTVARAISYAASADTDDTEATTIEALVDRLFPTPDLPPDLVPAGQPDAAAGRSARAPFLARFDSILPAQSGEEEEEEIVDCPDGQWTDDICAQVYGPTAAGDSLPAGKYVVHAPSPDFLPVAGIDQAFLDQVREGMTKAALLLHPLGPMPDTILFVTDLDNNVEVLGDIRLHGTETCAVFLYDQATALPDVELRQWIAFEMAICLLLRAEPDRIGEPYEPDAWQAPAAPYYLSAVAEPDGYLESVYIHDFSAAELTRPIERRHKGNIFFFLWLHSKMKAPGVLSIMQNTPAEGTLADVADALAAEPGMGDHLHEFTRAVADRGLLDGAGREYSEQRFAALTLPVQKGAFIDYDVERLGADRVVLPVPEGEKACISFEPRGDLRTGWRPFEDAGNWSEDPPSEVEGEWILVSTTVEEGGGYLLSIEDVVDSDDPCDEDPDGPDPIEVDDCPDFCGSSAYPHPDVDVADLEE